MHAEARIPIEEAALLGNGPVFAASESEKYRLCRRWSKAAGFCPPAPLQLCGDVNAWPGLWWKTQVAEKP